MDRTKEQRHQYYLENKEQIQARQNQYYADHRDEMLMREKAYRLAWTPETIRKIEAKKRQWKLRKTIALYDQLFQVYGDKCICCGESNRLFLTLDHINGNGTAERKAMRNRQYGAIGKAIREPDRSKYQILCYNCNCGKWRNKGICPHKSSP